MTLAQSTRYKLHQPVVLTSDFIVTFPLFSINDVIVYVDGTETGLFSVTATFSNGRADNAVVTLNDAVTDVDVELFGARAPRRENQYLGNSPRLADNLQNDVDAVTAVQQEQSRDFQSSLRVSPQSPITRPLSGDAAARANKTIAFSVDGLGLEAGPDLDTIGRAQEFAERSEAAATNAALGTPYGFAEVDDLLTDTSLSYVAGANLVVVAPGQYVLAGGFRYQVAASAATDHELTTAGGVKLYSNDPIYRPEAFGWKDGDDLASYLTAFFASNRPYFELAHGANAVLGSEVSVQLDAASTDKILYLHGSTITHTDASAKVRAYQLINRADNPRLAVYGGNVVLTGTSATEAGWHVQNARRCVWYDHTVWGSIDGGTNEGQGWLIENANLAGGVDAYCERTLFSGCGGRYLRNVINLHTSGGVNGGLSFARTIVRDLSITGGVTDKEAIKISSSVASLAVASANSYTIGETVTQGAASGTIEGWAEANDVVFVNVTTGTFDTSGPATGATSGHAPTPTNVVSNRLPNVYDSVFRGLHGNLNDGAILMSIGGGMRSTVISDIGIEAAPGNTAYLFRNKNNWTYNRPVIDLPDIYRSGYSAQIETNWSAPTSKQAAARNVMNGLRLYPSDQVPDTDDGVIAFADGTGWNPDGIGSGDGGKGVFAWQSGEWQRLIGHVQTTTAAMGGISNSINTTGKFFGKSVWCSTDNEEYRALGATAGSNWKKMSDGTTITPA
ncbi:hypothetical protein [Ruegeria lacuscaerulensis]|uniref:hypothetical protein n=1 Tax=Ruegeria lacuscaerulensis TaxID=55218 RepID=UPI001480DA98|nr:hypothetical protein [Ruegeria lacuscaerulensis]